MRIIYLHGFASGPSSRKAQFFRQKLEAAGFSVSIPALDGGDFSTLTISGQLRILEEETQKQPVILMGSSMGGYLASLYAARYSEVAKLILLAPAFGFHERWPKMIGEKAFQAWQDTGWLEVFHYVDQKPRQLGWQMAEDAKLWEAEPDFRQPALIFQGRNDTVVPPPVVRRFALSHSNVRLIEYDAGHELTEVMDEMWAETAKFLEVAAK